MVMEPGKVINFFKEIMLCDVKYDDVIQSKLFCSFGFGSSN
jgi:hypothetical protein